MVTNGGPRLHPEGDQTGRSRHVVSKTDNIPDFKIAQFIKS